jgi:diguanylate cyclase (GGDEF)-like protein
MEGTAVRRGPDPRRVARSALYAAGYVAAYLAAAATAQSVGEVFGISAWWLPAALTFALMVRGGARWYPLAVAAELTNAAVVFHMPIANVPQVAQAVFGMGAFLLAATVMTRVLHVDPALHRVRDVLGLLACGMGIASGGSAAVGVLNGVLGGGIPADQWQVALAGWWIGDAVAVAVLAVPLIMFRRPVLRRPSRSSVLEGTAQAALVVLTPMVGLALAGHRSYLFLCFIPLVWVALRRGIVLTAWTATILSVLTTYAVGNSTTSGVTVADLQLFMITLVTTALLLGSVVSQLQELNRDLERRVRERTAQLNTVNDQLAHEATHDRLTGLANRTLFDDRLQNALDRRRRAPSPLAVLLLDLDGFKHVNDTLGHEAGDTVLVEVAERLRACLRTEDTIARHGGDEFTILLDAGVQEGAVQVVTDRILASLARPIAVGELRVVVGASIGGAVADGCVEPGELLREADRQMYDVKHHGKGYLSLTELSPV